MFIQTDKFYYKPGEIIKFRVLILDEETRPFNALNVQISISDGNGLRIKHFDDVQLLNGVYQNELQLSDHPMLGSWAIEVYVNNLKENKNGLFDALYSNQGSYKEFIVAKHVAQKPEFTIDTISDVSFKDGKIVATINAKNAYGKTIKGKATITAQDTNQMMFSDGKMESKSFELNGKKIVEFDLRMLGISERYDERTVKLFGTFTEELSGKMQNSTVYVLVHKTSHKIKFEDSDEKFKPGLPFNVTALVNFHYKNAPVTDTNKPVTFTIKIVSLEGKNCTNYYDYYPISCKREESHKVKGIFPLNGIAELSIDIPSNTIEINVEVICKKNIEFLQFFNDIFLIRQNTLRPLSIHTKSKGLKLKVDSIFKPNYSIGSKKKA